MLQLTGTARTPTIDSGPNTTFSVSKYVMFVCTLSKTEKEAINPSSPPSDTSKQKATKTKKRPKQKNDQNKKTTKTKKRPKPKTTKKSDKQPLVLILLVNCSPHIQRSTGSRIIATSPTSDPTLVRGGVAATPQQPMPVPLVPVSKNDESVFQQKGCKRNQLFSYKKKSVFQQKRFQKESVVFIEKKPVFQQKRLVPGCSVDDVDGVLKRRFQIVCQVIHMRGAVPVISEMPNVTDIIEKSQSNIDKNPSD